MDPNTVIERLRAHRIKFEEPLTPGEISNIENNYKTLFPLTYGNSLKRLTSRS